MICYSSDQFYRDWRYAVDKEFTTYTGEPFTYANNGKREWGDEIAKLTFETTPKSASVSGNGKFLAVAVKNNIHIIETRTWKTTKIMYGHLAEVAGVAFKPDDSNTLVSSEEQVFRSDGKHSAPVIRVWKIDEYTQPKALEEAVLSEIVTAATTAVQRKLAEVEVELPEDSIMDIKSAFSPTVNHIVTKNCAPKSWPQILGRLATHFQSVPFSPSGKWMAYLPGESPSFNGNDNIDIAICDTNNFQDQFILHGHTDSIMWVGWSPDETLIATVSWDQTIRVWDATTGRETYKFLTEGQNWTGAFSPDSRYFAATCGTGSLQIYSLTDGSTYWVHKENTSAWRRALDWHPTGKWLAVGARKCGSIQYFDVQTKQLLQERVLSTAASQPDDEVAREILGSWLEVSYLKFLGQSEKLCVWGSGDSSVEVYDMAAGKKWRFSRGGTGDGPRVDEWRDENDKVTSKGGAGVLNWQNGVTGDFMIASIDFDGIRIWSTD
jgi:WD40 repeat protein